MAAIPPEIDQQIKLMNSLQKQMKSLQEQSEKLRTQQTENDQVLKELDLLDSSAAVFKLIGGLMVKQSAEEAKGNVQKRLDFIQSGFSLSFILSLSPT